MPGIKGNRRIIYTKSAIKDSLLELLKTNDIHQVTVTDICKGADINRGTFYAHYKDAYDLLQCMEDDFFNKIIKYIDETPTEKYYDSLLLKVLELIKDNKKLCKILLCRQGDNKILDKVISIASKANFEKLYNNATEFNSSYLNYYIRYVVGGCISIIRTWLDNDLPESPKELVTIINSVSVLSNAYLSSINLC